jgi:hypothetical protein
MGGLMKVVYGTLEERESADSWLFFVDGVYDSADEREGDIDFHLGNL